MQQNSSADVVVIGGGPSGSIAAIKLARLGHKVEIIERSRFPRFVIGESLLPKCNEILAKNGVLEAIRNHGFIVKRGVGFTDEEGRHQTVHFASNLGQEHNSTFQVKREEFDELLLNEAIKLGVKVRFETEVCAYDAQNNIVTVEKDGTMDSISCKFVIDASGYGRTLPRLLGLDAPSHLKLRKAVFGRVKNYVRREGEEEGYIDVFIHGDNDAWIWAIPFSGEITSVGIVCEESYFDGFGMDKATFFDHILMSDKNAKERFAGHEKINPTDSIDGYSSAVTKMYGKGYVLVGNATEFLDPVFSSGVTLALESGDRAAELVHRELGGELIDWEGEYARYMQTGIDVFREFVLAWYDGRLQKLLFSKEKNEKVVRSIKIGRAHV